MAKFGDYPLIQALDIAAKPSDPMTQLRALGSYFPMKKGTFWFAAGLSFNSFALVDGIAVVGVQIGDGLDINLLGTARMALRGRRRRSSRSSWRCWCAFPAARACCGCRAS